MIFWTEIMQLTISKKYRKMEKIIDTFYDLKIREFKQDIGASETNCTSRKVAFVLGRSMSEPTKDICQLIRDILMYTKFKLIAITNNNQHLIATADQFDLKLIESLLHQCKVYIVTNLKRDETKKSIVFSAHKIRFDDHNEMQQLPEHILDN